MWTHRAQHDVIKVLDLTKCAGRTVSNRTEQGQLSEGPKCLVGVLAGISRPKKLVTRKVLEAALRRFYECWSKEWLTQKGKNGWIEVKVYRYDKVDGGGNSKVQ